MGGTAPDSQPWSFIGQVRMTRELREKLENQRISQHACAAAAVALLFDAYQRAGDRAGNPAVSLHRNVGDGAEIRNIPIRITPATTVLDILRGIDQQFALPAEAAHEASPESAACVAVLDFTNGDPASALERAGKETVLCVCWGSTEHAFKVFSRKGRFADWLMRQFAEHLRRVLCNWMLQPEARVNELRLMNEDEEREILRICRGPKRDFDLNRSLTSYFLHQATCTPDATALIERLDDGSVSALTYAELEARISNCAAEIGQMVDPGNARAAAIFVKRSTRSIVAMLAAMRLGLTYVPLDPGYPEEYVRFILEDTLAAVAIAESFRPLDNLPGHTRHFSPQFDSNRGIRIPAVKERPTDSPFLIMYTSGSTGKPKGVVHCERQVINRLHWMWEAYPFLPSDRIAHRSPNTVMPSMWEILGGLLAGVPTVVISDETVKDPALFVEQLIADRVTFITLTPTLLRLLMDECESKGVLLTSLRVVIIGGDTFTHVLVDRFERTCPNATLVNDFGATEVNTVLHGLCSSSLYRTKQNQGFRPIANVNTYLLNERLQPVPYGIEGELVVSGVSVALGYHGLPETQCLKFAGWALDNEAGVERLYRTGETGYLTPDGEVHILGRRDHQVKINGMRVETDHVQKYLADYPGVSQCAVLYEKRSESRDVLHAYVVLKTGATITRTSLWTFLEKRLPSYMIPGKLTCLDALPRLPNGKIDRLSLAALPQQRGGVLPSTTGPENDWFRLLLECVAEVATIHPAQVDPNAEFESLGIDSIAIVQLARTIRDKTELNISPSLLYSYSTVSHLSSELARRSSDATPGFSSLAADRHGDPVDAVGVAIVGMSCQFPGAKDIDAFWANLCHGVDSVGTSTYGRWDPLRHYSPDPLDTNRSYSKWGGFLEGAAQFDPHFFGLTQEEAKSMDPQQRLALIESWRALDDAGYTGVSLADQSVGVFIGAGDSGYAKVLASASTPVSATTMLGNDMALIANRISYFLDLHGPSMVVNTDCSSSLVAVHLASRALLDGECTLTLAGGVFITANEDFYIGTSKLNVFSPTGQCRAFDSKANGLVHGEGVGFVVLKLLPHAISDGDHIYAVLRGTAVNQDGRSNGITAPRGSTQTALQTGLYRKLGINPESIGLMEAHGTGTSLGDPIEVEALANSFGRFTSKRQFCALGSVKTNIGHLTAAAGVAGLIKCALCLHHQELVPTLHFVSANPLIRFNESPFYVNTAHLSWNNGEATARRAAMNSFGIGGTNCHAVLEEYMGPQQRGARPPRDAWFPIPVTCYHASSVPETLRVFRDWIEQNGSRHEICDLSFTLLAGRRQFKSGFVFVASNMTDLSIVIEQALDGAERQDAFPLNLSGAATGAENLRVSRMQESAEDLQIVENYVRSRAHVDARKVASLIAASDRDWRRLFDGLTAQRIRIPVCIFDEHPYWPDVEGAPVQVMETACRVSERRTLGFASVLGDVLGTSEEQLDRNLTLADYGFDSLRTMSLQHRLAHDFGVQLPLESLLSDRTITSLADEFATMSGNGHPATESTSESIAMSFLAGKIDVADISESELDAIYFELSRELTNDRA